MVDLKKEQTLVIIKPDGVQRGLIGELIKRLERTGLKLVALNLILATKDQAFEHYKKDDKWCLEKGERIISDRKKQGLPLEKEAIEYGKDIINANVKFLTCGPVVTMVFEGNSAVGIVKKIVGDTEPLTSDVGTIRGDLTVDSYELSSVGGRAVRNLIHCSTSPSEAKREIKIWFDKKGIISYRLVSEQILYDVNLDGILE
ncbi:MAG: hypothetical protein A3J62_02660 [Candidatus Buchananbacteria bacterium RIFCSPHIGHO2_02_FULL_38_8]|uniref:nucleoside-diphosphate kinase n=1 Tax=Candidatus Buchananbacteria bacterium RIFCSPHIGHO2_02_FULL_38_8 TaxID=1797538 RepID=A0A1G1Y4Q2_9BACT|nr:MAG: hypothetical protein A3J62_02660 [Candidatus Buchananbacteria bacterium RIFCSPHIGHO2_02_FULL_38_8]